MNVFKKIKKARTILGLNQGQFANELGLLQKDVSKVENGDRKFIPNRYFEYLLEKGFDINTLFNDEIPLSKKAVKESLAQESEGVYTLIDQNLGVGDIENPHFIELIEHIDEKVKEAEIENGKVIMGWIIDFAKNEKINSSEIRLLRIESTVAKLLLQMGEVKTVIKMDSKL